MEGDSKAGFSIFWADDGLDTGPLLLQRECEVEISDTVDSLYTRFLLPEGIRAMVGVLLLHLTHTLTHTHTHTHTLLLPSLFRRNNFKLLLFRVLTKSDR